MSSIGAVAARIYTMQNKKGVSITSAMSDVIKENLAVRFSVYNLVRTITKSELLATIAQTKYGKLTPQQKREETQFNEKEKADIKFKQFTVSSIVSLNKKITALTLITKRNTELIASLYNDIGAYRGKQPTNTNQLSSRLLRVPLREKSVKGKIDKINADLDAIKEISKRTLQKRREQQKPPKPAEIKQESGGLFSMLLSGLVKNPLLMAALTGVPGGKALALGKYGIPALAMAGIPNTFGNIGTRLSGKSAISNPLEERISQAITPGAGAIGTYAVGMMLTNAYSRLNPRMSKAERMSAERLRLIDEQYGLGKQQSLQNKYTTRQLQKLQLGGGSRGPSTMSNLDKMYSAKLQRVKTYEGMQRVLKEYQQATNKANQVRIQRSQIKNQIASRRGMFSEADMGTRVRDRIAKTLESKRTIGYTKNLKELQKWNKITSRLTSITKRIPSLNAAYLVYKIAQMSNYVAQKSTGGMSREEFKKNMVGSYSDLASTLGSQGIGALIGGLIGTALFPGIGTVSLALAGGAVGLAASLVLDDTGASNWIGEKLFELFHEDRPYISKKEKELAGGIEIVQPTGAEGPPPPPPQAESQTAPLISSGLANDKRIQERTQNDPEFMKEVHRVASKFQIAPADLLSVMWRESRLLPDIDNPTTGATGLIQFMPETAKNLGTTTSALKKMSRAEQMKYVEKYFDSVGLPKGSNLGEIYSYVFLPGIAKKSSTGILASKNDPATAKYYNANQGLDVNRDGIITVSDLGIAAGGQVSSGPIVAGSQENKADDVQNAQINSIAAIQSVSRIQKQVNAVSTEAIKLRQKVKEQDDFPTTANQDMEQYA